MKRPAEEWLKAANDDLKVIEKIINDETLTNMIAFHSQQAIEKSFKNITIETNRKLLEQVNEIYSDVRYPSDIGLFPTGKPSIKLAKELYVFALSIKDKIEKKINI
jgi:hypothetical protein